MALAVGLTGVEQGDLVFEGSFKDLDELGGKGDFRDEQDDGTMGF